MNAILGTDTYRFPGCMLGLAIRLLGQFRAYMQPAFRKSFDHRSLVLCHSDSDMWLQAPMDSQFDLSKSV